MLAVKKEEWLKTASPDEQDYDNDRRYLLQLKDPGLIAIEAAKNGDRFILDLLLSPFPFSSQELCTRKSYIDYLEKRASLLRRKEIISVQIEILHRYYNSYFANILAYRDEIEEELKYQLDNLLYEYRLKHRNMLANETETIQDDGTLVALTSSLKVTLHKSFSEKLVEEFKNAAFVLESSNLHDAILKYGDLLMDFQSIEVSLKALSEEHILLIRTIENYNKKREEIEKEYKNKKYQVIDFIFDDSFLSEIDSQEEISKVKQIVHKQVSTNHVDLKTGNNLIHFAIANGHFETALFLMSKGVDYKMINMQMIAAIDTQNQSGDTLLHYLIRKRQFSLACDLIAEGANSGLLNNKLEHILDITVKRTSLIHFLLQKINSIKSEQKYIGIILHLVTHHVYLSYLLLRNSQGKTAYNVLIDLQNIEAKQAILETFKRNFRYKETSSPFQADIYLDLYRHFDYLNSQHSASMLSKIFSSLDEATTYKHLCFLSALQQHIDNASKNGNDQPLFTFLNSQLKRLKIPSSLFQHYSIHLNKVIESEKSIELDRLLERLENNSAKSKKVTSKNETSSYHLIAEKGILATATRPCTAEESLANTQSSVYPSPLQQSTKIKKEKKKCEDPLHWFEQKTHLCLGSS